MTKDEFLKKYDLIDLNEVNYFKLDIKYATKDNYTKEILYDRQCAFLRKNTFNKLKKASDVLKKYGYKIVIWDAFRPYYIQEKMYELAPDKRFVANPITGNPMHTKAAAVDITLIDRNGNYLNMPTEFDNFDERSYRSYYINLPTDIQKNVLLLENTMRNCGFNPLLTEWWHFNDTDDYEIIKEFYE